MLENSIDVTIIKHLERCLVLVKPDGVHRGLNGEILRRLELTGLKLVGLKMLQVDRQFAEKHYRYDDIAVRHSEAIWSQLLDYITEGPIVAAVFEGIACVATVRKICGKTEPTGSPAGTIRGDFCHHNYAFCNELGKSVRNLVHASATVEEAEMEVALWFDEKELHAYRRSDEAEHNYA